MVQGRPNQAEWPAYHPRKPALGRRLRKSMRGIHMKMRGMWKLLGLLSVFALAAFALSASGQTGVGKFVQIKFTSSPNPLPVGPQVPPSTVSVEVADVANDSGNSTLKSFKLGAPSGFTVTSVYGVGVGPPVNNVAIGGGFTATIQNNGSSVWVSNINLPLKPFGPHLSL